ncbi:hypothetical protein Tco_1409662 [Tanacetum coccineum]
MDVYTSILTQTDLNDLIIKYNIPCDLHPRLPPPGFVMSELPDDAIGIYHRTFGFFSVRIPFYTFLLTVIKHFQDHFSQLCPLGLNKRAIPHYMSWRHPNLGIADPKPLTSSNCQEDVWRLSAFIMKRRDMPEGVLVLFGLSRVWKSRIRNPILRDSSGNGMGLWVSMIFCGFSNGLDQSNAAILTPTLEDLVVATLNSKVLAKAKYSKKRRASTSGSSARTTLFDDNESGNEESEDDDDACYEIPIITPIHSQGKAVIDDVVDTPTRSAGHSQAFTGPTPVSRDPTDDAIDRDFFPFAPGPYYATYPEDGVVADSYEDPNVCKTIVDQFPTPGEMVRNKSLTNEHLIGKMSILYFLMISHGGELLARYKRVVEISLGARRSDTQKGDQIAVTKAYLDDIYALIVGYKHSLAEKDAEILYSRAQGRLVKATPLVATTDFPFLKKIFDHAAHPLSVIVNLKPKNLARSEVIPAPKTTRVSPSLTRESTVTLDSSSCEFPSNGVPSSIVAIVEQLSLNQNEEWVHAMVDTSDIKMMDGAAGRPTKVIVQGLVIPPSDIVVALSAQKKKWGSPFPKMFCLSWASTKGRVLTSTNTSWFKNSSWMDASPVSSSAFGFKALGRCVIQNLWKGVMASMISSMYLLASYVLGILLPST